MVYYGYYDGTIPVGNQRRNSSSGVHPKADSSSHHLISNYPSAKFFLFTNVLANSHHQTVKWWVLNLQLHIFIPVDYFVAFAISVHYTFFVHCACSFAHFILFHFTETRAILCRVHNSECHNLIFFSYSSHIVNFPHPAMALWPSTRRNVRKDIAVRSRRSRKTIQRNRFIWHVSLPTRLVWPTLYVRLIDPDQVSTHNILRHVFYKKIHLMMIHILIRLWFCLTIRDD